MAFEASTLVNGEWTTRTLDVSTVLRHYDQQDQEATANTVEIERAPVIGLLTQTVIRSPVIHWILPVKLRGSDTNDVAFIGVSEYLLFDTSCWAQWLFFRSYNSTCYPFCSSVPRNEIHVTVLSKLYTTFP